MQHIKWEDRFSVGIREFDLHHRTMVDMVNDVININAGSDDPNALPAVVNNLVQYTLFHFTAEEALLVEFKFPELEAHKAEHQELMDQVQLYHDRIKTGESLDASELLEFLSHWLLDHILGMDMEYGPYLNRRGID